MSAASVDTAKARADRAVAGVANARANIGAAEAAARNAAVSVDYTLIRAPFDGVILSKSANVGDLVTPFSNATDSKGAVVSMADMSTLEVEADVAESSLAKIKVGQPAEIELDALPDSALPRPHQPHRADGRPRQGDGDDEGQVRRNRPARAAGNEREGRVPSQEITPEQQQPLVAVHADALAQRDGRTVVFVVRDGKAIAVPGHAGPEGRRPDVDHGRREAGEKVVAKPPETLADDTRVKVVAK